MPTRITTSPRGASINPRKRPRQQRALALVDALIEASARVLVRDGIDRFTTNRVAEAAGVSVGSLYQYFPGKEALLAALVEREQLARAERIEQAIARLHGLPLAEAVAVLVRDAMGRAEVPLEQLLDQVERTMQVGAVLAAARDRIDRAVAAFIAAHFPQARPDQALQAGRSLRRIVQALADCWAGHGDIGQAEGQRAVLGYLHRFAVECGTSEPGRLPQPAGSP